MKRYPELFDPEFVEWWFSVEDALARGDTPPPRPKAFFSPKKAPVEPNSAADGEVNAVGGKLRQRRGPTGSNVKF